MLLGTLLLTTVFSAEASRAFSDEWTMQQVDLLRESLVLQRIEALADLSAGLRGDGRLMASVLTKRNAIPKQYHIAAILADAGKFLCAFFRSGLEAYT